MAELDTDSTRERTILDLRPLGITGALVLGHYHYTGAHPALPFHAHTQKLEICYLDRGRQTYRVGMEEFRLNSGDVFLVFPNEIHGTGPSPEERGDLYWLILDMAPARDPFLGCARKEANALKRRLLSLRPRHFRGNPELRTILRSDFDTFERPLGSLGKLAIRNSLVRFLLLLIECVEHPTGLIVSPEIAAIQAHIESSLEDESKLRLADMAVRCGMSLSRFKARFRKETGLPPAEFVLRRKIERSVQWLAKGQTVTAVAYRLGFSSSQHFATVFRQFQGRSPSTLRAGLQT